MEGSVKYNGSMLKGSIELKTGGEIEPITITENGVITAPEGIDGYNPITVNVQPNLITLNASDNGTYIPGEGVDGYNEVVVNVQPNLQDLTITANGNYSAEAPYDGLGEVIVNVSQEIVINLDDKLVANDSGTYITTNLDINLTPGKNYLVAIYDVNYNFKCYTAFEFTGGTQTFSLPTSPGGALTFTVTESTASMSSYGGSYRNIYATISELSDEQIPY